MKILALQLEKSSGCALMIDAKNLFEKSDLEVLWIKNHLIFK